MVAWHQQLAELRMKRRRFVQGVLSASAISTLPAAEALAQGDSAAGEPFIASAEAATSSSPSPPSASTPHWLLDASAFADGAGARHSTRTIAHAHWISVGEFLTPEFLARLELPKFTAILSPANAVLLQSLLRGRAEIREQVHFHVDDSCGSALARDFGLNTLATVLSVQLET